LTFRDRFREAPHVSSGETIPRDTSRAGVHAGGATVNDIASKSRITEPSDSQATRSIVRSEALSALDHRPSPLVARPLRRTTRDRFAARLRTCDVELDGSHPWDPQIHDERLFDRVLREGTLGLGEAYMDGWWDCLRLDEFIARVVRAGLIGTVWG